MNKSPTNRFQIVLAALLFSTAFLPANAAIIYVDSTAAGANDGSSWTNAYTDLQSAFGSAAPDDSIWVAAGTYKPTTGTLRESTFQLLSGVAIYGGFAGGETSLSERDWTANVTVLSGDIGDAGVDTDNSYHVVTGSGTDVTAALDGVTITKGYADESGALDGGGMYNVAGSPTIANVVFSYNKAIDWGGGMYNDNSSPTLSGVTFTSNSASFWDSGGGGGMCNYYNSNPTLTNVIFSMNSTDGVGGGMCNKMNSNATLTHVVFSRNSGLWGAGMLNYDSSPILQDVIFSENSTRREFGLGPGGGMINYGSSSPTLIDVVFSANHAQDGGGMYNDNSSNPTLVNVLFWDNSAWYKGGGMYNNSSSPTLINVSFSANVASSGAPDGYGGGMYNKNNSNPTLINTILWGNLAHIAGDEIYNEASTPEISYSLIANSGGSGGGWDTALGTDGGGNLDADPLFADGPGGDLRLLADSPAIDAGDNAAPNLPDADLDGNLRIVGVTVDMGPYENQSAVSVPDADTPNAMRFVSAAPNPFNPEITIVFEAPRAQDLTVAVYDLLGRCVRTLARGNRVSGRHEVSWNGRDTQDRAVASGTYIIRLEAESGVDVRKIALVR